MTLIEKIKKVMGNLAEKIDLPIPIVRENEYQLLRDGVSRMPKNLDTQKERTFAS